MNKIWDEILHWFREPTNHEIDPAYRPQSSRSGEEVRFVQVRPRGRASLRLRENGVPQRDELTMAVSEVGIDPSDAARAYLAGALLLVADELDREIATAREHSASALEVWFTFVLGCPAPLYTSSVTEALDQALRRLGTANKSSMMVIETQFRAFICERYKGAVDVSGGFDQSEIALKFA